MRELHQKVDSLPERAGLWTEKTLYYPDKPDETFTVRYRDPIEAVKTLLGDPSYAKDIVYKPQKIFGSNGSRIRTEMWTGSWWNGLQVSCLIDVKANPDLPLIAIST